MLMTKMLHLIDRNPDSLKEWRCKINCVKSPCFYKNNNTVKRFVCYKFYT